MTDVTFWGGNHPLCALAEHLNYKFMPSWGPTEYVETEVMRAIYRLQHDYFNNGFGNNMSQALAFIERFYLPVASRQFIEAFAEIRQGAEQPWDQPSGLEDYFNTVLVDILVWVQTADQAETLTPIILSLSDMPSRDIEFPPEEEEDFED